MSEKCAWLHKNIAPLPFIHFPFNLDDLPKNGIYFFYEKGEVWGHGGKLPRLVRVGTHKGNNFPNRISQHYLMNVKDMEFNSNNKKPSDRSIFRKNIGRVLLNRKRDSYIDTWEIDYTKRDNRERFSHKRRIDFERKIEKEITRILRERFSFKFVIIEDEDRRLGDKGLEKALIGTVAGCSICKPSNDWFGKDSPKEKICKYGLWQVQQLKSEGITEGDKADISSAISRTVEWVGLT